jgi:MarR family transcriptional regulator, organic hydroperoxide resistance regulator
MNEIREDVKMKINAAALESDAEALEAFLFQLSWISHRRLEQELNAFHLTVPQYIALNCIRESEKGCSMSQLAHSSRQVSATMTGIVDRLLDRGLVVRERDLNDRRTLRVGLTPAGEALLDQVQVRKRAWLTQFLGTLSDEDRKQMIGMAARYLNFIQMSFNPA